MPKVPKKNQPTPQGALTLNQRVSNNNNRLLAGTALSSLSFGEVIQKHIYASTSCRGSVFVNDKNEITAARSCKKRFCIACAQKYAFKRDLSLYPAVKAICEARKADPDHRAGLWFVTLTLPTCSAAELPARLDELNNSWRVLYKNMKKSTRKSYVNGVRKLEINPNLKADIGPEEALDHFDYMYHAHIHVLIQGRNNAYELRRRWLKRHPEAKKAAQDVRPFDHEKGTLIELVKYISKPTAAGESKRPKKGEVVAAQPDQADYVKDSTWTNPARRAAIVYIYECLLKRRTIFTYGTIKSSQKYEVAMFGTESGKKKLFEAVSKEFLEALSSLDRELAEIKSKPLSKSSKKRQKQIERQQQRILNYLDNAKKNPTRDLRDTIWHYCQGHYVNKDSGELLASEAEVEAADRSKDKKTYRLTKKALMEPKKRRAGPRKTTAQLVAEKREVLKKKQMEGRQYAMASNIAAEEIPLQHPSKDEVLRELQARRKDLLEIVDHRTLYFRDRSAYHMSVYRQEKRRIKAGLDPPVDSEKDEYKALLRRGLRRQRQFLSARELRELRRLELKKPKVPVSFTEGRWVHPKNSRDKVDLPENPP